ncbi:hypothetical protein Tco_0095905 [Tanacetum coccineum]
MASTISSLSIGNPITRVHNPVSPKSGSGSSKASSLPRQHLSALGISVLWEVDGSNKGGDAALIQIPAALLPNGAPASVGLVVSGDGRSYGGDATSSGGVGATTCSAMRASMESDSLPCPTETCQSKGGPNLR